jgi:3-hydroxyisobutyrate dehydrogenase-like beta-hydroxyacid dehydrogenase
MIAAIVRSRDDRQATMTTTRATTVAVIGTGDMGSAVGRALVRAGYRVVTAGVGRGALSRRLAAAAGIEDVGTLDEVVPSAAVILSIVPPAAASSFAADVARALERAGTRPAFVDCNAVAPATVLAIERTVVAAGAAFADCGIVGRAPGLAGERTRFYVSGPARASVLALAVPEIALVDLGPDVGRASALKMAYSALNKGMDALLTAVLLAAERLDVRDSLMHELAGSQPQALERMRSRVPFLAATAARFAPEMAEIASTYESVGITPQFHRGAEWLYALLATTPLARETRATQPAQRSLEDALAVYGAALRGGARS